MQKIEREQFEEYLDTVIGVHCHGCGCYMGKGNKEEACIDCIGSDNDN